MKAYVLHGIGDLRYEDWPMPELRPGWALVKVSAAGICSSDIPRIFEKGTYHFPTIPGHEFCGLVEAVADGADSGWIGKRVGVFPLIPCKQCLSCQKGQYETCEHYDYLGSRRDGGFAEYAAVPVWNLIELPEEVSDIQGALLEPAAVALHAVKRAEIPRGGSVCVVGSGTIGLLAGQWAKLLGAEKVFIKGRSEAKRQFVQGCGLEYITGTSAALFNCVIEAVGTNESLIDGLALASPGSRVVLIGNPNGDRYLTQSQYWSILRRQLTLIGTWNSSYGSPQSDWIEAVEAMKTGKLKAETVVSHMLGLDELRLGLNLMQNRTENCCKVTVNIQKGGQLHEIAAASADYCY